MTISELRALLANLPDDLLVAVRGYENGFDILYVDDVNVLSLAPNVGEEWFSGPSPFWFDGDLAVADDGVPYLTIGTTARKPER